LGFYGAGSDLPGFKSVPVGVQKELKEAITMMWVELLYIT